MPKFSANLSMLFTEVDFMQRFRRAKEQGFSAVEYMFPMTTRSPRCVANWRRIA